MKKKYVYKYQNWKTYQFILQIFKKATRYDASGKSTQKVFGFFML